MSISSKSSRLVSQFAMLAWMTLIIPPSTSAQSYTVRKLPTLGSAAPAVYANGINKSGEVVGQANTSTGQTHAFLWSITGGMRDLGTLGNAPSYAEGINANGLVVGYSATASSGWHAFLWSQAGGMQDLGTLPGGTGSLAWAINDSGQVVGEADPANSSDQAFLWTQAQGMQNLGTLPGDYASQAQAINNSGQIVGSSQGYGKMHAFLWTASGGMQNLGTLGGTITYAQSINSSGEVVGGSVAADGKLHAFLWTQAGGMKDLGTLGGPPSDVSVANAINGGGQVVGTANPPGSPYPSSQTLGVIWTGKGGPQDLNNLFPSNGRKPLEVAVGINAAGQIVGGPYANVLTPKMYTTLKSSMNPSKVGQVVTFTAAVTSIAGPPPDGESVIFIDGGTKLGTGTLHHGIAQLSTSRLSSGTHSITAKYVGDVNYAASKSPVLQQIVN